MEMNELKFDVLPGGRLPTRGSKTAAGLDLYSAESNTLFPGQRALYQTAVRVEIPDGFVGLVCPRSGLAISEGVTVLNAPGVVDSDFRGPIGVILVNLGEFAATIANGDRIAQLVVVPCWTATPVQADRVLSETERGDDGFGSTGR